MLRRERSSVKPVALEDIDESMVKDAVLQTKGVSGPSGLDADGWTKILASKSYGTIDADLRRAFVKVIKKIYALKSSLLKQPKMKHHPKCFWLADSFSLKKPRITSNRSR